MNFLVLFLKSAELEMMEIKGRYEHKVQHMHVMPLVHIQVLHFVYFYSFLFS